MDEEGRCRCRAGFGTSSEEESFLTPSIPFGSLQEASAASALATFHCFFLFPFIHCERAFLFNTMFTRRPVCDGANQKGIMK
jgi:hypothetical protein